MIVDTILLNVNMGLGLIDENLEGLMSYMKNVPLAFSLVGMAKSIGLAIALGVGAYETYMMMLGRRGMDVMKILRILILAICISNSGWIAKALQEPGDILMRDAKAAHDAAYSQVLAKEKEASAAQEKYVNRLSEVIDSVQAKKREAVTDIKFSDGIGEAIDKLGDMVSGEINSLMKKGVSALVSFICEWIQFIIRFVGEVIFQMIYYGLLVAQRIALYLMSLFMPIVFALSLAPPYKSAWAQYISKFLSITLWGFVIYVMMFFIDHILMYFISLDCKGYADLLAACTDDSWEHVATLGIQGVGSTCMYVVAMLIGAKVLSMAPELAGWLIPGGVSSSAGSVAGAMAMGAATGTAAVASGTVAMVHGGTSAVTRYGAGVAGATAAAEQQGASPGHALLHGIISQTSFGKAADAGGKTGTPFTDWGKYKK